MKWLVGQIRKRMAESGTLDAVIAGKLKELGYGG